MSTAYSYNSATQVGLRLVDPNEVSPPVVPGRPETAGPARFLSADVSWVELNSRYLRAAQEEQRPLLERVRWFTTYCSRLDQYLVTSIPKHRVRIAARGESLEQLGAVHATVAGCLDSAADVFATEIAPALAGQGISIVPYAALTASQRAQLAVYFGQQVFPLCTPLALDAGHPFPFLPSRSLSLIVTLASSEHQPLVAFLHVPSVVPRLVPVPGNTKRADAPAGRTFIWLEDLIAAHLGAFFPGLTVQEAHVFYLLRQERLTVADTDELTLLQTVEENLRASRFAAVTALQVHPSMPEGVRALLTEHLKIDTGSLYLVDAPLRLRDLRALVNLPRPDLKYAPLAARVTRRAFRGDPFRAIRSRDLLLHHPYDSIKQVLHFIEAAACDPKVIVIKQTLYHIGPDSPFAEALLRAAASGKQVTVVMEIRSPINEESDLSWTRALREMGVNVVHGLREWRTHSKLALVVRREKKGTRLYAHIGSGNYRASLRTDLSLLTCDPGITTDVAEHFNYLTGHAYLPAYRKLLVAPARLRLPLLQRIEREIGHARQTGSGHLIFKTNSIADPEIIDALYCASAAGVQVDLIVRSRCCLRPGVPGLSDQIRVVVPTGRFVEHSRLYYFRNDGDEEILFGSADLMPRSIDARVELLAPVQDAAQKRYLRNEVLAGYLRDKGNTAMLGPDGLLHPMA